jgi:tetratricopeptide (TPR) repeat protein
MGAFALRRQLAEVRPDVFRPDLANSLNTQSTCLADLGRHEEALAAAEEAVAIYRQLSKARPPDCRPGSSEPPSVAAPGPS